jgi:leucyl-tRNA synthetase
MVARYGADSTRMYTLFAAPPDRDLDWQDAGVEGISRFLSRVYRFVARNARPEDPVWRTSDGGQISPAARRMQRKLHQTLRRVTDDFGGRWHFNTSIAAIMELTNELYAYEESVKRGADTHPSTGSGQGPGKTGLDGVPAAELALMADAQRKLVLMLAPFAPYLASELWEMMGETSDLLRATWPKYDPALAKEEEVEIGIQINGKIRSRIVVSADASDDQVRELALADEKVKGAVEGKEIVKVLVVKGRLVNIIVK